MPVQIRLSRLVHDDEAAALGGEVFDVVHGGEEEDVVLLEGFRRPVPEVKETLLHVRVKLSGRQRWSKSSV